jgi:class 3 adenylate cyclase
MIKKDIFEAKIKSIQTIAGYNIPAKDIKKLREFITTSYTKKQNPNPFDFAKQKKIREKKAISLFLYSSKAGIFDLRWNQICPCCGGIHSNHSSINSLNNRDYYCYLCDETIQTALDEWIDVTFKYNPSVFSILKCIDEENQYEYASEFFSANLIFDRRRISEINRRTLDFQFIESGETKDFSITPEVGKPYKIVSFDFHDAIHFEKAKKSKSSDSHIYDIEILKNHSSLIQNKLYAVPTTFRIKNTLDKKVGILILEHLEDSSVLRPQFKKFLTGKMLLNNQLFRDLYKSDAIDKDLSLNIKSLTVLFSDLKGSTALYGLMGDIKAYDFVNKHFDVLTKCIDSNNGSVIKTIGDAVMASFNEPINGINASFDIIKKMRKLAVSEKMTNDTGIKIGLNEGSALAVNLNNSIDYFGQAVNIAARVQGLAESNEIWITNPVFCYPDVKDNLDELSELKKISINKKIAHLKGISDEQTVFQIRNINQ